MILAPTLTLSAGSGAAIVRPTFSRDFAGEKTLNNGTGPAISFTRGSNATFFDASGVLQTASSGVPRFDHNPVTGASLGLLIEEQRANLVLWSEAFDNAAWVKATGVSVTPNTVSSPLGTLTADTVTANSGAPIYQNFFSTVGSAYCHSVFIKAGTVGNIMFRDDNGAGRHIVVNATTGAIVSTSGALLGSGVVPVGNGWFRIWFSYTTDSTFARGLIRPDGGGAGQTFYLFGFQSEVGAFPTSYIPTTTTAATRAADVAAMTGANFSSWYRQDEGTLFAETVRSSAITGVSQILGVSDGTSSNRIRLFYSSNIEARSSMVSSGVEQGQLIAAISSGLSVKAAYGYVVNNLGFAANGGAVAVDTSAIVPSTINDMRIGADVPFGDSLLNGHICRLAYYPSRLSNARLRQLTA